MVTPLLAELYLAMLLLEKPCLAEPRTRQRTTPTSDPCSEAHES